MWILNKQIHLPSWLEKENIFCLKMDIYDQLQTGVQLKQE
jgi:hypothetical protein